MAKKTNQMAGGYELVLSGVVFSLIGLFIDSRLGTGVLFFCVFAVLGFIGSALSVYYRYKHRMNLETSKASAPTAIGSGVDH